MDDWDTVTKIGSKTRSGGGAARETVVRGKSALNAAQRSGNIIGTEKKFATGNAASKSGTDGQRQAKIDRDDNITKPIYVPSAVGQAMIKRRNEFSPIWKQSDLATKANLPNATIQAWEKKDSSAIPDEATYLKLERALGIKLRGNIGAPLFGPRKKDAKKDEKKK